MKLPTLAPLVRERLQDRDLVVVDVKADAASFFVRIWSAERRDHWQGTYADFGEEFLNDPEAVTMLAGMIEDDYRQGRLLGGWAGAGR